MHFFSTARLKIQIPRLALFFLRSFTIDYYEIFNEIKLTTYTPSSKAKLLENGIVYLNKNALSQNIDYDKPAEIFNICSTYFHRECKEIFGVSPSQYVRKIRMDYSKELLLLKQYSVSDITNMWDIPMFTSFQSNLKMQ